METSAKNRVTITFTDDVVVTLNKVTDAAGKQDEQEDQAVKAHFSALEVLLSRNPLPTINGGVRTASASEFMLMQYDEQCARFKHSVMRNYVLVEYGPGVVRLRVPRETVPFYRGWF